MGQVDIIKLLLKNKKGLTAKELSDKLKISQTSVCSSLIRLKKQNVIMGTKEFVYETYEVVRWRLV